MFLHAERAAAFQVVQELRLVAEHFGAEPREDGAPNRPISVMTVNVTNGIRTAPAGSDTRCRTTGSRREKKMPPAE